MFIDIRQCQKSLELRNHQVFNHLIDKEMSLRNLLRREREKSLTGMRQRNRHLSLALQNLVRSYLSPDALVVPDK